MKNFVSHPNPDDVTDCNLLKDYAYSYAATGFTPQFIEVAIDGLTPNAQYELVLYSAGAAGQGGIWKVNGSNFGTTTAANALIGSGPGVAYIQGAVAANANGVLTLNGVPNTAGGNEFVVLNGFQLEASNPIAVTSSLNPSPSGTAVTFTATVSGAGPTPTGTVTFEDGTTVLGASPLSSGVATLTTASLPAGTSQTITAIYSGDSHFAGNTNIMSCGQSVTLSAYYVSPTGSDLNPGTLSSPFATLAKAQSVVRISNQTMTNDINVFLRGGTYALTNTLSFGPTDSGNNGHKVIYRAYGSETPIISGGKTITGWTLANAQSNIWQASVLPSDNFRQIYVNGLKGTRAFTGPPAGSAWTASQSLTTTDLSLQNDVNPANMEIVAQGTHAAGTGWIQDRFPIASIIGTNISIQEPCAYYLWCCYSYTNLPPIRLENSYSFLTQPNYWYLNLSNSTLYYIPGNGVNMTNATIEAPVVQQLITISGSSNNPVSNLSFVGLTFRLGNWVWPSLGNGVLQGQANQTLSVTNTIPAVFDCTGARNVGVYACTFEDLGAVGINFHTASQNDAVVGCTFSNIAASAIQAEWCETKFFKLKIKTCIFLEV